MPTFTQLMSSTTNKIIFITVVIHLLKTALLADAHSGLELYSWHLDVFKPWQFVTHIFLHGDYMHLFFNMFGLWWLGNTLEKDWGNAKFLAFYLLCGIFAGVISQLVDNYVFNQIVTGATVGASGSIYGLLAAFALLHPNFKVIFIFLPIPVAAKFFVPILLCVDLFSGVTGYSIFGNNIAHFAHIGGALVGFILTLVYKRLT